MKTLASLLTYTVLYTLFINGIEGRAEEYVLEGGDVTLKCRIPRPLTGGARFYWMGPVNGTMDNYAIGDATFNKDYRVDLRRMEGRYDLTITRATYDRNNGLFICRVKEEGTGFDLHSSSVNLTVLIKPSSPRITPLQPSATQGHPISITCASQGGSPDPEITWYRVRDNRRLQSVLKPGGGRDFPTTAVLTIQPQREDDGAEFLCEVRNKALAPDEKMAATVRLNVNYYPIVKIEPSNPVRVVEGNAVTLKCTVDAKPRVQNVRWMRGGIFVQTNPVLTISNASPNDAGRYICQADNRLPKIGEAEVTVDVLYPPAVSAISRLVVNAREQVGVACNVTANPHPDLIYWTKIGDPGFKQKSDYLRLSHVSSADHGDYVCHAVSILSPSGKDRVSVEGNATTRIRVKHAPGKSFILPPKPVAVENGRIVLTCGAKPPGYPEPKYRWWRNNANLLEIGENYTINIASQSHEGEYHCQPYNSDGNGTVASVQLRVFQPPRILEGLKPSATYFRERTDLRLSCEAQGKPKPIAKWLKDGKEITEESGLYSIEVNYKEIDIDGDFIVQSTLIFRGSERIGKKALRPEDRGLYECVFENEAKSVSSSQLLRVQHPPATVHKHNKVAANPNEEAQIICKMRAYPSPSFQWLRHQSVIEQRGRYSINNTALKDDIYVSILTIKNVRSEDYGDYTCRASNDQGPSKTVISLQEKSSPDPPTALQVVNSGKDFVEVGFEEGFNGGFSDTNISVLLSTPGEERVVDCLSKNPCLVQGLSHNTDYRLRLQARNGLGKSEYSVPILAQTSIDPKSIPSPKNLFAEVDTGTVVLSSPDVKLNLVGRLEVKYEGSFEWTKVPAEITFDGAHGNYDLGPFKGETEVRAQLCVKGSHSMCGPFEFAQQVEELPYAVMKAKPVQNLVAIIVGCVAAVAVIAILALFVVCCCCRQSRNTKLKNKNADLEVSHRGVVTQQAPPPPYYTVGLENKGMDGSIDRGLESDPAKSSVYNTQQYQSYGQNGHINNMSGTNGYMDNSYSNSNNGGSVNSQDSLWQVKGHHNDPGHMSPHQMDTTGHNRSGYQYNPVVHGGYGGYDDYAHYPPMPHQQGMAEDYPPSHHGNYNMGPPPNGDHYGVHRGRDESYDVSGMPDPYIDHHDGNRGVPDMSHPDTKPQISFDESLESGFSTPNSRSRRIIREIIV